MKRFFLYVTVSACMVMYCLPAFGWGQEGHRIIAKIAYDNLTPKARKQVDKILGERGIIYWANWPDEIKSDTIYPQSIKDGWHFQDFNAGLSDSLVADALIHYPTEGGSLFRALDSLERELKIENCRLKNPHTLRFVIHLSGDRYCPVHVAHMDDKGANEVKMKWFGRDTADCYNPKVVQATMGALARVRVHYVDLPKKLSEFSRQYSDLRIFGTLLEGKNMYEVLKEHPVTDNPSPLTVIVMGNEGNGISQAVRERITHPIRIPSYPADAETSESLNVSIATAIVLAEFRRP